MTRLTKVSCAPSTCSVGGCDADQSRRGLCVKHYARLRRHGDPLRGQRYRKGGLDNRICSAPGCENPLSAKGFCGKHYMRVRTHGDVEGGKFHHSPHRREWHLVKEGYVWRYAPDSPHRMPNGYVFQHREIMGEIIGRPLLPHESVHHKNGNRADNAPVNLELWVSHQPSGQRPGDLIAWAKEILILYPDHVLAVLEREKD
jgi:hypothetical protein